MSLIHYVSIMMRIFYIDWQQHWECHRTVNIGEQQNSHKGQTSVDQLGFQWHRRGIEFSSHQTVSQSDCFTLRPFFAATYVFVVWNLTRLITRLKSFFGFFLTSIWWGSTQLQCIYYLRCVLISRPPRVFRRFKRRSCYISTKGQCLTAADEFFMHCKLVTLLPRMTHKWINEARSQWSGLSQENIVWKIFFAQSLWKPWNRYQDTGGHWLSLKVLMQYWHNCY